MNSDNDRETPGYTASEYASTILEMLRRYDKPRRPHVITNEQRASRLITHVVCLEGGNVNVDETAIKVCDPKPLPGLKVLQACARALMVVEHGTTARQGAKGCPRGRRGSDAVIQL